MYTSLPALPVQPQPCGTAHPTFNRQGQPCSDCAEVRRREAQLAVYERLIARS